MAARLEQGTYSDFRWDVEVAEASGAMAYTVGFERFNHHAADGRVEPVTVRVTHVYRRENGAWEIVLPPRRPGARGREPARGDVEHRVVPRSGGDGRATARCAVGAPVSSES